MNKVISYLSEQQQVIDLCDHRITISATKNERAFEVFKNKDSVSNQVVSVIANNDILLKFIFLKIKSLSYADVPTATTITYPICLQPDYDFEKLKKSRPDYQKAYEKLESTLDSTNNVMFGMIKNLLIEMFESISDDPGLARIVKDHTKNIDRITSAVKNALEKNPNIMENHSKKLSEFLGIIHEVDVISKTKQFIEISPLAHQNSKLLESDFLKFPENIDMFNTALRKLANYAKIGTETLCLDCWFEHELYPFVSEISRTKKITLIHQCEQCGQSGLIHNIHVTFPDELITLLVMDSSWLYEEIIAQCMAELPFVDKVYVHKKIHPMPHGKPGLGWEIDISIITDDKKLYIVEVTKQSDSANLMKNFGKKLENYQRAGIPFEKAMYFTASDQPQFWDLHGKGRMFGIIHLPKIKTFATEWMRE